MTPSLSAAHFLRAQWMVYKHPCQNFKLRASGSRKLTVFIHSCVTPNKGDRSVPSGDFTMCVNLDCIGHGFGWPPVLLRDARTMKWMRLDRVALCGQSHCVVYSAHLLWEEGV